MRITMAQKPVNSLNYDLLHHLKNAVNEANANSSCSSIILSSSCRVFSAGLDLNSLHQVSTQTLIQFWTEFQDLCFSLYGSEKFIISEINGHAPAAGTILSMCCDIRIAVNGSKVGLNEAAFGLVVPIWAGEMLSDLIGTRLSYFSMCQGTLFTAEEAQEIGLVDVVVDAAELEQTVEDERRQWTQHPGRAANKLLLRKRNLQRWVNGRGEDLTAFVTLIEKEETQKRIAAYLRSLKK
jgi:enoyl-CoA hydratase/carnithine racemase